MRLEFDEYGYINYADKKHHIGKRYVLSNWTKTIYFQIVSEKSVECYSQTEDECGLFFGESCMIKLLTDNEFQEIMAILNGKEGRISSNTQRIIREIFALLKYILKELRKREFVCNHDHAYDSNLCTQLERLNNEYDDYRIYNMSCFVELYYSPNGSEYIGFPHQEMIRYKIDRTTIVNAFGGSVNEIIKIGSILNCFYEQIIKIISDLCQDFISKNRFVKIKSANYSLCNMNGSHECNS